MFKFLVRHLKIVNFRCIELAELVLTDGVNLIAGANNSGKSTLLEAIALLASHDISRVLTESDYYSLNVGNEFNIEATIVCIPVQANCSLDRLDQLRMDGESDFTSKLNSTGTENVKKQFKLTIKGSKKLKLKYKTEDYIGMQQSEVEDVLKAMTRTHIIGSEVKGHDFTPTANIRYLVNRMANEQQVNVQNLNHALHTIDQPNIIQASKGMVVESLGQSNLEFSVEPSGITMPLQYWGNGTNEFTRHLFTELQQKLNWIRLIDNFEGNLDNIGLLNYFKFLNEFYSKAGIQAFITVRDSNSVKIDKESEIVMCQPIGIIGSPKGNLIKNLQQSQPELFFSKLVIIGEGSTEVGFLDIMFDKAFKKGYKYHGMKLCDGGGNDSTEKLAKALVDSGLRVGMFVDKEFDQNSEHLEELISKMGLFAFQWGFGNIEWNIMHAIPWDQLPEFITKPEAGLGPRLETIAFRLGMPENFNAELSVESIKEWIGNTDALKHMNEKQKEKEVDEIFIQTAIDAASGKIPANTPESQKKKFSGHGRKWFKSLQGGRELALKVFSCNAWENGIKEQLMPYVNANRNAVGLDSIDDLYFDQDGNES